VAYSVECQGRRVVYTGDTGFDEAFAEWAAGCDVLLAECSLPDSMAMAEHLTPQQCAALAERVLPRHLVLTHFYPPVELVDIAGIVGPRFAGALTLASDGWTLDIEDV
jgi:ribonuclease BN (tRNA processing enzyme)